MLIIYASTYLQALKFAESERIRNWTYLHINRLVPSKKLNYHICDGCIMCSKTA